MDNYVVQGLGFGSSAAAASAVNPWAISQAHVSYFPIAVTERQDQDNFEKRKFICTYSFRGLESVMVEQRVQTAGMVAGTEVAPHILNSQREIERSNYLKSFNSQSLPPATHFLQQDHAS